MSWHTSAAKDKANKDLEAIEGDEFSYSKLTFAEESTGRQIEAVGSKVTISASDKAIDGADNAALTVAEGGSFEIVGTGSSQTTASLASVDAKGKSTFSLVNSNVKVDKVTLAESEISTTKSTLRVGTYAAADNKSSWTIDGGSNVEVADMSKANGTLTVRNSSFNVSGEISAKNWKPIGTLNINVENSSVNMGLQDVWVGNLTLKGTADSPATAILRMTAQGSAGGTVYNENLLNNKSLSVGGNSTLVLSYAYAPKNGSIELEPLDQINATIAKAKSKASNKPSSILYTSMELKVYTGTTSSVYSNKVAVGSGVDLSQVGDNNLYFGADSLLIVDRTAAGNWWSIKEGTGHPVIYWKNDANTTPLTLQVDEEASLYLTGISGKTMEIPFLSENVNVSSFWTFENIYTDEPLYAFTLSEDGRSLIATLQTPSAMLPGIKGGSLYDFGYTVADADATPTHEWFKSVMRRLIGVRSINVTDEAQTKAKAVESPASTTEESISSDAPQAAALMALAAAAVSETSGKTRAASEDSSASQSTTTTTSPGRTDDFKNMTEEEKAQISEAADRVLSSAAAAGVLSTAFDQTSEFVQAVMDHIGPMKRQETNAWATVIGDKTKVSGLQSDFGYSKLERDSYGIAVGADVALAANLRAGAAFAYTSGSTKNNSNAVLKLKDEFSSMSFGIYSRYGFGPFTVDAHAGYTRLSSDLSDNLGITDADVDTDLYTVGVRGGFGLLAVDTVIYPFIGADLYVMETADYSIAPGVKSVAGGKTTTLQVPVGFKWRGTYGTVWGAEVSPEFALSWAQNFGDRKATSRTEALGEAVAYDFEFVDTSVLKANLGLGLKAENFAVDLQFGYAKGSSEREAYNLTGNAAYLF